jgi:soluble lytic murein transglycosylase
MQRFFKLVAALLFAGAALAGSFAAAQTPKKKDAAGKPAPAKLGVPPKKETPAAAAEPINPPSTSIPPSASPQLSEEERAHKARYDTAITAVRDLQLADAEAARIRDAVKAIGGADLPQGKQLRDQLKDGISRKLVDWYLYRGGYGAAAEIRAFAAANPDWPDQALLQKRAEEALFNSSASAAEVKAFFADVPPATGVGLAALAAALAPQNGTEAKALAAKAWVEYEIPSGQEATFLKKVGNLLTDADHKRRLDRLLLTETRWAGERKDRATVIRRTIALLPASEKKTAEARLAVFLRAKNSGQLMAKLPPEAVASQWGLAVQKAQVLRRQNKDAQAWKILLAAPESTLKVKPDGWWEERRSSAYAALREGNAKTAYALVRDANQLSINSENAAHFLAGWIALRHLKDAKAAEGHFGALVKSADGPLTRARAYYWHARAFDAMGEEGKARESYKKAAEYIDTFHGQLARLKLDPKASALKITAPAAPTSAEIARFNGLDTVRAAVIAHKAGLDRALVRAFLSHIRTQLTSEAEFAMLAHLAEALDDTQMAVRIGKAGISRGLNLMYYAYPIHKLPAYRPIRQPAETALILGIARQESEFGSGSISHAGARGILQVMPGTARHICREYKLKCDVVRLLRDAAYNTMMGSAYIADRMDEFSGSYILSLAGYNAGPGRAREWIREFGDPREKHIDPIDWIHRIPITETREYVQKVLSNVQIYRARLGEGANAVRLNADLRRSD